MASSAVDDVRLIELALTLLQQFGWHNGYRKLHEWLPVSDAPVTRSIHAWFLGWQAWERGDYTETRLQLESIQEPDACRAWALCGLALTAMRQRDSDAVRLMNEAAALASPEDRMLAVVMDQGRGAIAFHQGKVDVARRLFAKALTACGDQHFLTGRIYDAIGMTWLETGNFYIAVEFFHRALEFKERPQCGEPDLPGLALTHGQLGRLYLDWGLFDQAEHHFQEDLRLCERLDDQRGRAQMLNALGRVALARCEAEGGDPKGPLQHLRWLNDAAGWIEGCLKAVSNRSDWIVIEGYARLDQARLMLHCENLSDAKDELSKSEELFGTIQFAEGNAHVDLIRGRLARLEHDWPESLRLLNKSLRHFETTELNMVPRILLEIARTRRDSNEPRPIIISAYRLALESAEQSRRSHIVAEVERDLELIAPLERLREEQRRSRGRLVRRSTVSLIDAERDTGSVLYLDIQGSRGHFISQKLCV